MCHHSLHEIVDQTLVGSGMCCVVKPGKLIGQAVNRMHLRYARTIGWIRVFHLGCQGLLCLTGTSLVVSWRGVLGAGQQVF